MQYFSTKEVPISNTYLHILYLPVPSKYLATSISRYAKELSRLLVFPAVVFRINILEWCRSTKLQFITICTLNFTALNKHRNQ